MYLFQLQLQMQHQQQPAQVLLQASQPQDVVADYSTPTKASDPIPGNSSGSTSEYTRQEIQTAASQIMTNIIQRAADEEAQQTPVTVYNVSTF